MTTFLQHIQSAPITDLYLQLKDANFHVTWKKWCYRLGTVNSKSFIGKVLLRIMWNFELIVHFKHKMLGK